MEKYLKDLLKKIKENEPIISTILGAVVIVIIGVLIFNYFQNNQKQKQAARDGTESPTPSVVTEEGITFITKDEQKVPQNLPTTHKVESGEHLWEIAEEYYGSGYNWVDIAETNNLDNPDQLNEGQELTIPQVAVKQVKTEEIASAETDNVENPIESDTYTVQKGDSLWKISVRAYGDGYQWPEISRVNNINNPGYIEVGQELQIPR